MQKDLLMIQILLEHKEIVAIMGLEMCEMLLLDVFLEHN
jgi:hypothetical protein